MSSEEPTSEGQSEVRAERPALPISPVAEAYRDPDLEHLPELKVSDLRFRPQRRTLLPILLFLATCVSTFWVGCTHWQPLEHRFLHSYAAMGEVIGENWATGLKYMIAVLAILLTHEMGHFLQTVKHRIAASYPLCIPIPFNAIGTMGAVIGMDGMRANRRQIFDIGIAGPLAGLVVAIPVFWWGIQDLDLSRMPRPEEIQLYLPWLGQWMLEHAHPEWTGRDWIGLSQLNPYFMAGWVGMLITGLNMMPISQLDGGHTIYALFLDRAHTLARWFVSLSIFYILIHINQAVMWTPMLVLVILMGIHHPPTANDHVKLGPVRWAIGLTSLFIPLLCFPLQGFRQ
jgi:membrane-associated protease RseP (regulator of RpoE activity)